MFDFAWSEIGLIGIVALILIGPKDMPVAIKAVTDVVKKARRMAAEFQTHVDEMVREANLGEVREQINEIRNFDFKGAIESAVDEDGSIRRSLTEDPFATPQDVASYPPVEFAEPESDFDPEAPAFIPAGIRRGVEVPPPPPPPSFVPPDMADAAPASHG